jgi:ribosomal protein L2
MVNKGDRSRLGATNEGPKPGDFPVGTPQSRAAARAALESLRAGRKRIDVISSIPRPGQKGNEIHIGDWIEQADGSLFRFSNIPAGMTIEEAERKVAERERRL